MKALLATLFFSAIARAQAPDPLPYKLYWSFPGDDVSAIEIDDPDLHVSKFGSRWELAQRLRSCDAAQSERLLKRRARDNSGVPLREIRIDSSGGDGAVRTTVRCVLPLAKWRGRLGERLLDRLEDELDAHMSVLVPRRTPGPVPPLPAHD